MAGGPPRTMAWRVGLALMAVQLLAAIILVLIAYPTVRNFHLDTIEDQLQHATPLVVAAVENDIDRGSLAELQNRIDQLAADSNMRITIIVDDGNVLADSAFDASKMANYATRPEIRDAITSGSGSAQRYSQTLDQRMLYRANRIAGDGELAGVIVRTSLPLTRVNADFFTAVRGIFIAGTVSIMASLLVTYFVSRHFLRRVEQIADAAARFAEGDLTYRIPGQNTTELAILARSLNTMSRQLQTRLTESRIQQEELQAVLDAMSSGVIALDREHRILNISRVAAEMIHANDDATIHGRLLEEVVRQVDLHELVNATFADEAPVPVEFKLATQPASRIQAATQILSRDEGEVSGIIVVLNDVTEIRRLESLRTDFAANVSHELRTPITNIKGYIETLLSNAFDHEPQSRRFLEIIEKNSMRLEAIVEDVLSLTYLEGPHGRVALETEMTTVQELLDEMKEQFTDAARSNDIGLHIDVVADLQIDIHRALFEQAVSNLVTNAIRYSPKGTNVRIHALRNSNGEFELTVADEGPGIAAKHLPRLFERFYRVDRGRSRELGGTGLGLAIVKHIINEHDGNVSVESEVGHGSTFRITLPDKRMASQ